MPDLLYEIGCEELPPGDVASGERQLEAAVPAALEEGRLPYRSMEAFATPRRLAILCRGLEGQQEPTVEERRGPPADRAYDAEGAPTQAARGFAEGAGISVGDLVTRSTEQGDYVFSRVEHPGRPAAEVLPELLVRVAEGLVFPKTMRWDASGVRFPRPIRWLVALLDRDVLPVRYAGLEAGRHSRGHRVFHPGAVELSEASAYPERLAEAGVVVRRSERREWVAAAAQEAAEELDGTPILHAEVLDEVADLVERPVGLVGRFDDRYLELPRQVLITVMESHQRYFGVEDAEGRLLPGFVCVSNADPANAATIVSGNERVLRARLEDARFFFQEDLDRTLSARVDELGGLVLHGRLGTMLDKAQRVSRLAGQVAGWLGLSDADGETAEKAAELCKADLLTHLVYEFPELQGVMGREYAKRDPRLQEELGGRLDGVAEAVYEHYLPRFPSDDLPSSEAGVALSLADRLDTLVGYLGIGLEPSGSEDPFALRRQATGFAQISLERGVGVPVREAVGEAHRAFAEQGVELESPQTCTGRVMGLLRARAEALLEREGTPRLFIDAAAKGPWGDLADLAARARAVWSMHRSGGLHSLAVAYERAFNLSREASAGVDEAALEHAAEQELYSELRAAEGVVRERTAARDYMGALDSLGSLVEVIEVFFDKDRGVLVMDPDERLRRNRLALLRRTADLFGQIADLSVVPPKALEGDGDGAVPSERQTQEA